MTERPRALVFGEVAELYEAARPSYPEELADEVIAFAGAAAGDAALEVGAGTGKATALFAGRGLELTCLEPSPPMAAVLRRVVADIPNIGIEDVGFEAFVGLPHSWRLIFSAQAWHWVDPEVRFVKAHELLMPDGALALFWNRDEVVAGPLRDELDRVYERLAGGTGALGPSGQVARLREIDERHLGQIATSGLFGEAVTHEYPWEKTYATEPYIQLLSTYSDHRLVEEDRRERLLAAVAETIDAMGSEITLTYATKLYLARPG